MSAKSPPSVRNGKRSDEDVGGGMPLRDPTPVTTPSVNVRERLESETHYGSDIGAGVSNEEDSEEESSDDRSPLNKRVPNQNLRSYGAVPKTRMNWGSLKNKFRLGRRSQPKTPPPEVPRCECHPAPQQRSNKARNRLLLASGLTLVFMIAEIVGGSLSNSLAIMTDAAHMLSDFASFLISLFAIWISTRSPTKMMSYGWHRAEVLGAIVSVLLIWVLTGVLLYEAILRVIHQDYTIDANIMLITATVGVFVNVFMCMVLHQHDHGHGHGHGEHSHGSTGHAHGGSRWKALFWKKKKERMEAQEDGEVAAAAAAGSAEEGLAAVRVPRRKKEQRNINVQAAFIHVIGDLIQSVGVVIAAYIIRFRPDWHLADPICTFLFSLLVLFSTLTVLRDALRVLMEASPRNVDYQQVLNDLQAVKGVKRAHGLHIWSLTMDRVALSVHLVIDVPQGQQEEASTGEAQAFSDTEDDEDLLLLDIEAGSAGCGSDVPESSGVARGGVEDAGITECCISSTPSRARPGLREDGPLSTAAAAQESAFQDVLSRASQMLQSKYCIHQSTIQVESALSKDDACHGCNTELPPPEWWLFCCNWGGGHHHH